MKRIALIIALTFQTFAFSQSNASLVLDAFTQSYTQESNGEYTKAIETLKKVYDAENYEINLRLGWLHYSAGLFTESNSYYQKAIGIMPYSIEARLGIVYPASALGNWDQVIQHYQEILKIDSKNTTANYRLGSIYYGQKKYDLAVKHLEAVVNLYPFDYDSVILLAWSNYQLGKLREAKILFQKALLNTPTSDSAKEGLALIK